MEVDETLSLCLKSTLQKDASNWDEVIDKWQKTFTLRKQDLATRSNSDFLQEWPMLKDSRAPFLVFKKNITTKFKDIQILLFFRLI